MHHYSIEKTHQLFHKGMGYVADKHIYKFKDFSECVFETQIQSKWWLVETLVDERYRDRKIRGIDILASWYGIVIVPMLVNRLGYDIPINLYDVDEYTCDIAEHIYKDDLPQVKVHNKDVVFDRLDLKGNVVINCSCEHMYPMSKFKELLNTGVNNNALYVLQSSNATEYDDHINCVEDADELAEQANLMDVMYAGEKFLANGMTRFMVIGR